MTAYSIDDESKKTGQEVILNELEDFVDFQKIYYVVVPIWLRFEAPQSSRTQM
jgi:hypothetical protein